MYDTEAYNQIALIDKERYYDLSIVKECNNILKGLIKAKIITKPKFKHEKFPMNTYKEFIHKNNKCTETINFEKEYTY